MHVRTRIAPSPTGYVHVGNLRTALYAYYVARQNSGTFFVRIEDTDQERLVPGAVESLLRTLGRMGMDYDEGPTLNIDGALTETGAFGPYIQSKRLELYQKYAEQLVASGHAYRCFCSKEWLEKMRAEQSASKRPMGHIGPCSAGATKADTSVIRFRMPQEGSLETADVIRGAVRFPNTDQEDFVLLKTDGFPTYHLASVVDDHLMETTHVIRGEEWLSSLPKHYQLYEAFGWTKPVFAHLPLILNPDRSKLSKRQGDVAVEDYLAKGYLPAALENFISLIGYNPKGDQEIYTREEMIRLFDLSKVNSAGGVFNKEKLDWMNQQYIQKMPADELVKLLAPFLSGGEDQGFVAKVCAIERDRAHTLKELADAVAMIKTPPTYEPSLLVWKKADAADAKKSLEAVSGFFQTASFDDVKALETATVAFIAASGMKNGNVLWPTRVALSGRDSSPSPFQLAWMLGKEETLKRLKQGLSVL